MGTLFYGDARVAIPVEDRALAHLQIVMINKLRRGEAFTFSWTKPDGDGRSTVWLSPEIALHFDFDAAKPPAMNRRWLEELSLLASSGTGLTLVPEPEEGA